MEKQKVYLRHSYYLDVGDKEEEASKMTSKILSEFLGEMLGQEIQCNVEECRGSA